MRLLYLRPLSVSRTAARLLLVALSAIPAACDKVPLLAPTESTITLSSNTTTLAINGTAEIIATVIESAGTPVHNGTTVTFTASVGVIEPRDARTENGIARATFRAGTQSGTARVGAFSGAARAEEVEILVGGAAAQTVALRLDPPSVPQTGGTVQVIALVSDVSGNRLPGAPVVFSADNGSLGVEQRPHRSERRGADDADHQPADHRAGLGGRQIRRGHGPGRQPADRIDQRGQRHDAARRSAGDIHRHADDAGRHVESDSERRRRLWRRHADGVARRDLRGDPRLALLQPRGHLHGDRNRDRHGRSAQHDVDRRRGAASGGHCVGDSVDNDRTGWHGDHVHRLGHEQQQRADSAGAAELR